MIEFCRENSFYILNGRLGDDKTLGNTTCRHVSCIDYFVCNVNMFDFCCDLSVDEFCPLLSDVNRPISLKFRIKTDINDYASQINHAPRKSKLWDSDNPENFVDNIDILKLCEFDMLISSSICEQFELDSIVEDISRLFMHSAYTAYGDTSVSYDVNCDCNKKKYSKDKPRSKPWYDNECEAARRYFTRAKNVYNRSKTQANAN